MIQIPESPLLTAHEAVCYLRLVAPDADPDEVNKAVRCLNRLVQAGKIHPIQPGRHYLYALAELARYVRDETERFEPQANAH